MGMKITEGQHGHLTLLTLVSNSQRISFETREYLKAYEEKSISHRVELLIYILYLVSQAFLLLL